MRVRYWCDVPMVRACPSASLHGRGQSHAIGIRGITTAEPPLPSRRPGPLTTNPSGKPGPHQLPAPRPAPRTTTAKTTTARPQLRVRAVRDVSGHHISALGGTRTPNLLIRSLAWTGQTVTNWLSPCGVYRPWSDVESRSPETRGTETPVGHIVPVLAHRWPLGWPLAEAYGAVMPRASLTHTSQPPKDPLAAYRERFADDMTALLAYRERQALTASAAQARCAERSAVGSTTTTRKALTPAQRVSVEAKLRARRTTVPTESRPLYRAKA